MEGKAQTHILEKAIKNVQQRDLEGLQNEKDKELLLEGASRLQRGASAAHEVARTSRSSSARIQECDDEDSAHQST
jgi:hypothetical protein